MGFAPYCYTYPSVESDVLVCMIDPNTLEHKSLDAKLTIFLYCSVCMYACRLQDSKQHHAGTMWSTSDGTSPLPPLTGTSLVKTRGKRSAATSCSRKDIDSHQSHYSVTFQLW